MRSVRVYFKKTDRMKFVSHLDMNRVMTRVLNRSGIPFWYTEGFNPHPYITFLLPLSLGFESDYEIMEIRIVDDNFTDEMVKAALSEKCPEYIEVTEVFPAVNKAGKIAFASYSVEFSEEKEGLEASLSDFLERDSIITEKKGKKGRISEIDLAPKIKEYSFYKDGNGLKLNLVLPAGGSDNVNPSLILKAYRSEFPLPYYKITRTCIYDAEMNKFR